MYHGSVAHNRALPSIGSTTLLPSSTLRNSVATASQQGIGGGSCTRTTTQSVPRLARGPGDCNKWAVAHIGWAHSVDSTEHPLFPLPLPMQVPPSDLPLAAAKALLSTHQRCGDHHLALVRAQEVTALVDQRTATHNSQATLARGFRLRGPPTDRQDASPQSWCLASVEVDLRVSRQRHSQFRKADALQAHLAGSPSIITTTHDPRSRTNLCPFVVMPACIKPTTPKNNPPAGLIAISKAETAHWPSQHIVHCLAAHVPLRRRGGRRCIQSMAARCGRQAHQRWSRRLGAARRPQSRRLEV